MHRKIVESGFRLDCVGEIDMMDHIYLKEFFDFFEIQQQ